MSNKYQEAFNNFKTLKYIPNVINLTMNISLFEKDIETLQELVDKATPNIFVDQFGVVKCGNCKEPITHPKFGTAKYCLHCGQKLNWEENNAEEED